ncbi:murein biosynthesis integral membrane protein MurJ [Actinoplanes rectilineatus]|uniref:murein biosynthesis integral membrane protein MurJ n=1 Tax=Actinoplanes rectilineatus TaxID=113571 RepID=UPI0005F2E2F3|nr:murein biosynthesis integral membrane protein MurJ [Actinoplanes rectilineatus]
MALATLASRAAGFLRILVLASALGLGTRMLDAYNIANTLPNAVYELVVGGAMASVIVPLLTRATLNESDGGVLYTQKLLSLIVYLLSGVTLAAVLAAPLLIDLYTPAFTPDQRDLAILFSRFFLPQMLFYGMSAGAAAVLNIRGRFGVPAWAPLVNSVVVIAVGLTYLVVGGTTEVGELTTGNLLLLGVGTTAGVVAQCSLVVWGLSRSGFPVRLRLDPRGIAIRQIGRLSAWMLLSVVTGQILVAAATRTASWSGTGSVTVYQNASAIFHVPFAVIAVSVMTAMLPRLSRHAARNDHRRVITSLSRAVRTVMVIMAPIAAAMIVLGPQIAVVLFAHGNSATATVDTLGTVVSAFGLALIPFTNYMLLQRGLFALQDTRTAALIAAAVATVGVIGCLAAGQFLPRGAIVIGIPVAYAAAYTVGLTATAVVLRRRLGLIDGKNLIRTHVKVLAAATVGATCAVLAMRGVAMVAGSQSWTVTLVTCVVAGLVGGLAYLVTGYLLRLTELRHLLRMALNWLPSR